MRALALALLLLPSLCWAQPVRVLGVYDDRTSAGQAPLGRTLAQLMTGLAPGFGLKIDWVGLTTYTGSSVRPVSHYTLSSNKGFWGKTQDYEALVVAGWNWPAPPTGQARLDSMTRAGKYPQIPVLFLGANNGFSADFSVCSVGVAAGYRAQGSGFVSFSGKQYRFPSRGSSGARTDTVSAPLFLSDGERILTAPGTAPDSLFVWHRSVGAGITVSTSHSLSDDEAMHGLPEMVVAVLRWLKDLADTREPRLDFPVALHIDDGWMNGGRFKPQHWTQTKAWMDSLSARRIRWTVGVACDSIRDYLDDHKAIWDRGVQRTKFTPHSHSRDGATDGGGVDRNAQPDADSPTDVFGNVANRPNCDADPLGTIADTSSVYAALKVSVDSLKRHLGEDRIDWVVMPPSDDYTPVDINKASGCAMGSLLNAIRRAGFTGIRLNGSNQAHGVVEPSGYHTSGAVARTASGDLRLLKAIGYATGAGDSASMTLANQQRFLKWALADLLLGTRGRLQSALSDGGLGAGGIVVTHPENWKLDPSPAWQVVRALDDYFLGCEAVWGAPVFRWVWSQELSALPRRAI